jgi:hypothetical protein
MEDAMPTPAGLLKVGDKIADPDGTVYIVTERLGNSRDYAARIRREDGRNFTTGEARGRPSGLFLNAAWKLRHGWSLVPPDAGAEKPPPIREESTALADIAAIKANLASLNEVVAELVATHSNDLEFTNLVRGTLRQHSFDLGFEFQGERGPSSYDPVMGELGGRDFAAENPDKCANCGEAVVPRDVGMDGSHSWKHQIGGTVLCIIGGVRTGAHAELRESAGR